MAKEIDKIIQSKTAPKSNNVLWDDGENLKINRNGKWESTSKESSSNQELYAYPVDTLDGKENKVVGLGGEKFYMYIGEISIPADMEVVEGTLPGDIVSTEYAFQSKEGALQQEFSLEQVDSNFNLYIGNDKYGYTSLKIEPSEDSTNLKWFWASSFGMLQEGSGSICFAYNNRIIHYRAYSYVPYNIKVYGLSKAQKLDINLIPQEIARKEDIATEINNHEYPTVTIDADTKTYSGQLGSKCINIDINISSVHLGNGIYSDKKLYLRMEDNYSYQYSNSNIFVLLRKNNNEIMDIALSNPTFTLDIDDLEYLDYKNCDVSVGNCRVEYNDVYYSATIDFDNFVTTLINGKYFKYKLNRETHLLELQSEIDLNSIESRLAALEAK